MVSALIILKSQVSFLKKSQQAMSSPSPDVPDIRPIIV